MGVGKVKAINLEDGRLVRSESGAWVYTGARGTFTGSTPAEALAKAYNVNVNAVEVRYIRFRDFGVRALVCVEGWCELHDVECEGGPC